VRVGTVDRITVDGDLVVLDVLVDGDIESPIPILDLHGVHSEVAEGQPVLLLEQTGPTGESVAILGSWRKSSVQRDLVALKADMDSAKASIQQLQGFFGPSGHTHSGVTVGAGVTGPPSATADETVQSQGSDAFQVTHG
jgi:hypothetical protein